MKKIYNRPEMECLKLSEYWALCTGGGSNNEAGGTDSNNPFGHAPKRRIPAF